MDDVRHLLSSLRRGCLRSRWMVDTSCLFLPRNDPSASSSTLQSTTADMNHMNGMSWGRVRVYCVMAVGTRFAWDSRATRGESCMLTVLSQPSDEPNSYPWGVPSSRVFLTSQSQKELINWFFSHLLPMHSSTIYPTSSSKFS